MARNFCVFGSRLANGLRRRLRNGGASAAG
jgi:hypothetical protein